MNVAHALSSELSIGISTFELSGSMPPIWAPCCPPKVSLHMTLLGKLGHTHPYPIRVSLWAYAFITSNGLVINTQLRDASATNKECPDILNSAAFVEMTSLIQLTLELKTSVTTTGFFAPAPEFCHVSRSTSASWISAQDITQHRRITDWMPENNHQKDPQQTLRMQS